MILGKLRGEIEDFMNILPWYKGFGGEISEKNNESVNCKGIL